KNVVGNWQFAPIYTYETGEWGDVQSNVDSNLNGDTAGDRAIFNPKGVAGTGSGVTDLCNSSLPSGIPCDAAFTPDQGTTFPARPFIVGYLAKNGNAQFITAQLGTLATSGRNNVQMPAINNVDLSVVKRFAVNERASVEFGANLQNLFN